MAGTGAVAVAKGKNGLVRVGGWGEIIGDEGSANWIGKRALGIATRALDGRSQDIEFARKLMTALAIDTATDEYALLGWVHGLGHPRSAIASVARHIDALAEAGDAVAQDILAQAADALAAHGPAAQARAGLPRDAQWATAGSLFKSQRLSAMVASSVGRPPVTASLGPLAGGLRLAALAAGWDVLPEWVAKGFHATASNK